MIQLTDSTEQALARIATAPATSDQPLALPTYRTTPAGEIRIQLGQVCGTVSSWHLVPSKLAQLRRLLFSTPHRIMSIDYRTALAQPETPSRLHYCSTHGQQPENAWGCPECVREMRQQLAQPEPEGANDEEREAIAARLRELAFAVTEGPEALAKEGTMSIPPRPLRDADMVLSTAADMLTRFARLAIKPVPVSERLPGPADCDAEGRCWWFNVASVPEWQLAGGGPYGEAWLPHHALPVPTPKGAKPEPMR
jgi:hypothetical protein